MRGADGKSGQKGADAARRDARLAEALRSNLKRRKAQTREQASAQAAGRGAADTPLEEPPRSPNPATDER